MNRRHFLKNAAALGSLRALPVGMSIPFLAQKAMAFSPNYQDVSIIQPSVMPQVINIFMYGGASELAGNLSNIVDIEGNSQNSYASAFGNSIITTRTDDPDNGQITDNGFWYNAGGQYMEQMLANNDLSVYRTILKQKSPTRSHRESIFMSHKGTLDIENSPGVGTRLALMLYMNQATYAGTSLADGSSMSGNMNDMILPFVSFEGESTSYATDPDNILPLQLRALTMNNNFDNPYTRGSIGSSETTIETLLSSRLLQLSSQKTQFQSAWDGFDKRAEMETLMSDLSTVRDAPLPISPDPTGDVDIIDVDGRITYPNNSFANQVKAAVTLALANPETLYITVGTPGLGGWDDHNNGVDRYPNRMNQLMQAVSIAMKHIRYSTTGANSLTTVRGNPRNRTDNIVINVYGDFGRLVNLNNSGGWDHANNQNLYTFGGSGVRPAGASALGKVVGTTYREGTTNTNNQYTMPDTGAGSPSFEPMAIASSIYSYFGAQNSQIMTADPDLNPDGDLPIDETL